MANSGRGLTDDEKFNELLRDIDKDILYLTARIATSENNVATDVLEKITLLSDIVDSPTSSQPLEPEVRNTGSEPAKSVGQGFNRPKNIYDLPFDVINRCYLLSRTLNDEERLNYLIILQRKVTIHIFKLLINKYSKKNLT